MIKKKKVSKQKYEIPNLMRAFAVLEYIAKFPKGVAFPQILEDSDCSKTTLFRILISLENSGYIRTSVEGGLYFLSRKFLSLSYSALGEANISAESFDVMRALRDKVGETTMLGVLIGDECIMIEQEAGSRDFNFTGKLGMKSPLHASAPGKALLAFLPKDEYSRIISSLELSKITPNTICDIKLLEKEFDKIRAKGYSTDSGEVIEGLKCVAAPIFDNRNYPIAVIWITGTSNRVLESSFEKLGKEVLNAAREISKRLGYKE